MKVKITFFKKDGGKYYSECHVDIPVNRDVDQDLPWAGSVTAEQAIVDHQTALVDSWCGNYHVVTQNDISDEETCELFWLHFYSAERFVGRRKSNS